LNFEGKSLLNAEPETVWDVLLDVNRFAQCMPGVDHVTQIDDSTFDGAIEANVGPISGKFTFRATIVDSQRPTKLTAQIEGSDSVTKSKLIASNTMTLTPVAGGRTELAYRASVDVKGRLAILGDMVLRTTASLLLEEFTKRLGRQVEESQTHA
jgi:uncharacterized protein